MDDYRIPKELQREGRDQSDLAAASQEEEKEIIYMLLNWYLNLQIDIFIPFL